MSEAMWEDDLMRRPTSSSADVGAMARRPSVPAPLGAGPLPDKAPITISDEPGAMEPTPTPADEYEDLEGAGAGPDATPEAPSLMTGDPAAGRAGLWSQGAPPAYAAPVELPPAYSEQDPHPERVPWWKRARRSIGRGVRKIGGWLGLGSLFGPRR